jgi:uncharacterized protein (TIGR02453 family)
MAGFSGFPPEAFSFFAGLEADNSKTYWAANKATYEAAVKAPMTAFAEAAAAEFGTFHLFRPHRDVRFAKDKSPYKTHQGAVTEGEGGEVFYVHLSAEGAMAATGYYMMATDQLERHRAAVAAEETGAEIATIVAGLEKRGYQVGAHDTLKTAPRGYPKDHPRVRLLRLKGLTVSKSFPLGPWLHAKGAHKKLTDVWRGAAALNAWLARNVGPSTLEPPDAGW